MTRPIALPGTRRRRGNPNWGKPPARLLVLLTEFEMQVERLGLNKKQYVASGRAKALVRTQPETVLRSRVAT
jgi:hypothetical protein